MMMIMIPIKIVSIPHGPTLLIYFPRINPTSPISGSGNVTCSVANCPIYGRNNSGSTDIITPATKPPSAAPRLPPVKLPYTPAVAPTKKCAIIPGIITVIWHAIITPMDTNPPTNDARNPTIREFGA